MKVIPTVAGAAALGMMLIGVSSVPAEAGSGDVIRRGDCSGPADWKVKVGPEDGRLEFEGEVDSNRSGQRWRWSLRHNGVLVSSGVRYTSGTSGSFTVRRTPRNLAGTDTFVFRAVRPATGQVCRGVVRF